VILISAEDDPHDTIRPRLDAHRANVEKVHLLNTMKCIKPDGSESETLFSLGDIDALEEVLQQLDDCRLVVIDPIGSFLGGKIDAHRDNEVRSVLAPVAKLAEKYGPAVMVVAHRRKAASNVADDMAMGSRAFTGIARSVWHLSRDTDDKQRRLLLSGKCNLAIAQSGLAFTIGGDPASIRWERDPVEMTADEALALESKTKGSTSATDEAEDWLRKYLSNGPRPGKEVQEAAQKDGIKTRSLNQAKANLEIVSSPDGFGGQWVWKLPVSTVSQSFPNTENTANTGDTGGKPSVSRTVSQCSTLFSPLVNTVDTVVDTGQSENTKRIQVSI
jgi:putative DNA primase/helicase